MRVERLWSFISLKQIPKRQFSMKYQQSAAAGYLFVNNTVRVIEYTVQCACAS